MQEYKSSRIFWLGLGFFSISLVWQLYDYYVPLFLRDFIDSQFLINMVMTLDNILAITLIPYFAALSDRTNNRFGRRMPFLLVGIPLAAIFFSVLPNYQSLAMLVVTLLFLNLSMAVFRAPTVALMPDVTPIPLRSRANGIINFMGGLGAVLALSAGARMYSIYKPFPFYTASFLIVASLIILKLTIKEDSGFEEAKEEKVGIVKSFINLFKSHDKKMISILGAIFLWFVGYQGVLATFSNYAVKHLGITAEKGSFIILFFALFFLLSAIPAGMAGEKFGKKKVIIIGLFILIGSYAVLSLIRTNFDFAGLKYNHLMMIMFAVGGFGWALVNINSYPYVLDGVDPAKTGTYTGLYYFFSSLAAILGPLFMGFFIDIVGFDVMFPIAVVSFIAALGAIMYSGKADANV